MQTDARPYLGLHQTDAAKDAEVRADKQLGKRLGMSGLMRLWHVQKQKQGRSLEEILSPYTESMCALCCFKMILKFYSTLRRESGKTVLDWRKCSVRDLKSFICLVYQKVDSEVMVLSVFKAKKWRY